MASASPAKASRLLAKVMFDHRGRRGYDDKYECTTSIRCNGRVFQIDMSPFFICDSPIIESRYRKFINALFDDAQADSEESEAQDPEDVVDEFHAWLIAVFEPVIMELANTLVKTSRVSN